MGYNSDSPSHDRHSEDDEDEEEDDEAAGGNRLMGFMFGNVDNSGDLDVDYLDEDAKEHFAALADKLGTSLKDIDLSYKSLQTESDVTDQDYGKKSETAVNYEDFDEAYEGPEIQAATEEDFLLPKKDYFSQAVPVVTVEKTNSVFDDENYDDDDYDELENQDVGVERNIESSQLSSSVTEEKKFSHGVLSQDESPPQDADVRMLELESSDGVESDEDISDSVEARDDRFSLLPVLCVEDGKEILRFSEIFGIHERPITKTEKRDRRYVIDKEKYTTMDASDFAEEDEEVFFKATFKEFPWSRPTYKRSEDCISDDKGNSRARKMSCGVDELRKDSFVSSESMKDFASLPAFPEWNLPSSPDYCSVDQQDWEEQIIWNNSPLSNETFAESVEVSGPDSDTPAEEENTLEHSEQTFKPEIGIEPHNKDHQSFLNNRSISLEPFGTDDCSHSMKPSAPGSITHPQLLRLESRLENLKGAEDAINRFSQLTLQNRDVVEGSWSDDIVWEPYQSTPKPKLILDLQDQQMLFELLDLKDAENLQLHAGAMIMKRSVLSSSKDSLEHHGHVITSAGKFDISNDRFYLWKSDLRPHPKKRAINGLKVSHSLPALKLQTMKAKLSNKDLANFHRPKTVWYPHDIEVPFTEQGRLAMQGTMKIIVKSLGGKGSKLHVDVEETISSVKAKASKKLDFQLGEPVQIFHSGRELEDDKSLAEQSVRPNSVLHLIRTRIHQLPRAQKIPGENKSLRPPGAFKKKSDLSVKDGHVLLMEYCEERPLLLGNPGMGARLCTYYQKSAPGDQMGNSLRKENNGLGSIVVLDTADKSPFLGDINPGSSQSSLETNMYRAPLFQHNVSPTDYLLVRSPKGKLSIRRIDRVHTVGQQQPLVEVMSPGSKNAQLYLMNRLLVQMYRQFRASEKRGLRPSIRFNELFAQFPNVSDTFVKKKLKTCADMQKGPDGQLLWVLKRSFRIPSEEELRTMVTPENVCAYESMQAGLYRLKRLGITSLTSSANLSSAMNLLPDEAIALFAASVIERELLITPWNLSSNFVSCTNQGRENIERLEITGVGDPSGRGLGFSYIRTAPKAPISNAMVKKKTVVSKGTSVTGTDADLRRLSMDAARELLLKFGVPEDLIAKQTRWHRIAMIRKLSSEQAASGLKVDATTVSKFARGQRMSFLQLQQQNREKCQEIWDRQVQSLCAGDGEEIENESEANSDLDSFAGDLENLLDAEEGEEDDELKVRRPFQTQQDEEIEDEAAEAAELCRILMDDEEANRKKIKKAVPVLREVREVGKSKLFGNGIKKKSVVTKKFMKPDGSFSTSENVPTAEKEGDSSSAKKFMASKLKGKKKIDIEQMGLNKKIKILGDGMNIPPPKKSARETFVCGACGQFGHMRTNKNCPNYGEYTEARVERSDAEKIVSKPDSTDQAESSQQKPPHKKPISKNATKSSGLEPPDDEKPKAKFLKVKCGGTEKILDKATPTTSQNSERLDADSASRSSVKVNKITFSNKIKSTEDNPHRPSIVIKPPADAERDQPRKKIIIKQPKEIITLDENSQDGSFGFDYRKTKTMLELSSYGSHRVDESQHLIEESSSSMRNSEDNQWWAEDERRRSKERQREEKKLRSERFRMTEDEEQPKHELLMYEEGIRREREKFRMTEEEQPKRELLMYEEGIRREREEEERQKREKAKKKKKIKLERNDFSDGYPSRRNDTRRIPEKERSRKRAAAEHVNYGSDHSQATKRRRAGEVGLSNILENIEIMLRSRTEISYLFIKPVSKKEAPDYLDYVSHPMDLSKIREKARKMQYRNRDEFRHDVYQITYNAHAYNDRRNPGIPPLADQLLELCDYLLQQHDEELTEAEEGIERSY